MFSEGGGALRRSSEKLQGMVVSVAEARSSGYPLAELFHMTEHTAQCEHHRDRMSVSDVWREGRWGRKQRHSISFLFMRNGNKVMSGIDKGGQRLD